MSACTKRNSELLKVLAKCKPELRKAILKAAEDDLLEAIRQCLLNVWFDTIKLKPKTAKKLAPHSSHIKFAANERNPIVKRRTVWSKKGRVSYHFYSLQFWNSWLTFYNVTRQAISTCPEHTVEQRKKPLAAPLATQVNDKIYQSMKRQSYTTRICNAI